MYLKRDDAKAAIVADRNIPVVLSAKTNANFTNEEICWLCERLNCLLTPITTARINYPMTAIMNIM
jgi:hypothetical protein